MRAYNSGQIDSLDGFFGVTGDDLSSTFENGPGETVSAPDANLNDASPDSLESETAGSSSSMDDGPNDSDQNSAGKSSGPDLNLLRFASVATDNYYVGATADNGDFLREDRVSPTTFAGVLPEPLQSINWGYTAPSVINVFFAGAGVTVNDGYSDSATFTTTGWSAAEIAAANLAFQNFENVCNVQFNIVNTIGAANFVMFESSNATSDLGYWAVGGRNAELRRHQLQP